MPGFRGSRAALCSRQGGGARPPNAAGPGAKRLRTILLSLVFSLLAFAVRAEVTESDIRGFEKGKTTYKQVVALFGAPAKTEADDEGLIAIGYPPAGGLPPPPRGTSVFGSVAGAFSSGAGASGDESAARWPTAFVFDRNGLLLYYSVALGGPAGKQVTSEDGAGPMPNVSIQLSAEQRSALVPMEDGKPHLGIQLVPVGDLDQQHRADFAAAKFNGVVVANVLDGSAAQRAGMRIGDYLYVLNGALVTTTNEVLAAMSGVKLGDRIRVRAKRIDQKTHLVKDMAFDLRF